MTNTMPWICTRILFEASVLSNIALAVLVQIQLRCSGIPTGSRGGSVPVNEPRSLTCRDQQLSLTCIKATCVQVEDGALIASSGFSRQVLNRLV